jgi:sterol desaturase/sphingolipid hydroxylase (fatty acid hydroxylase superfamily)
MRIEDLVPIAIPAAFVTFILVEQLKPARPLPRVPGWRLRGVISFLMTGFISASLPLLYVDLIRTHRLMNLEGLGTVGGAAVALLAGEFVGYWWHRLRHRPLLWRLMHQMHHSAERVDIFGSAYFHPLDIAGETVISGVVATMTMGVSGEAAAMGGLVSVLLSLFQHTNVRTPRWLGFIIQRPESHSVHHARGVHAYNYGNLAIYDMLFRTFRNPERFEPEAGFYDGASARVGAMLLFRDLAPAIPLPTRR